MVGHLEQLLDGINILIFGINSFGVLELVTSEQGKPRHGLASFGEWVITLDFYGHLFWF